MKHGAYKAPICVLAGPRLPRPPSFPGLLHWIHFATPSCPPHTPSTSGSLHLFAFLCAHPLDSLRFAWALAVRKERLLPASGCAHFCWLWSPLHPFVSRIGLPAIVGIASGDRQVTQIPLLGCHYRELGCNWHCDPHWMRSIGGWPPYEL